MESNGQHTIGSGFIESFDSRYPTRILETLLQDRTTGRNIIWADNEYEALGEGYMGDDEITVAKITGLSSGVIKPRIAKEQEHQSKRTKSRAEVFQMPSLDRLTILLGKHIYEQAETQSEFVARGHFCGAGVSLLSRRNHLIPTQENSCRQGFSTLHLILYGSRDCTLRSTPTYATTPRIAISLILSRWTSSTSTGLSRARMLVVAMTRLCRQNVERRSPW